jgi:tetrahydromethanopterin S-methyltransferase subunit F
MNDSWYIGFMVGFMTAVVILGIAITIITY